MDKLLVPPDLLECDPMAWDQDEDGDDDKDDQDEKYEDDSDEEYDGEDFLAKTFMVAKS